MAKRVKLFVTKEGANSKTNKWRLGAEIHVNGTSATFLIEKGYAQAEPVKGSIEEEKATTSKKK